uniref:La domain protein n=1 Tax=Toxoplasma gondii COUG TaxID=1074873 RepID=A0A2G8Y170_TOXGO|nr:la domain protein [Toxoplasma gondii COUG]
MATPEANAAAAAAPVEQNAVGSADQGKDSQPEMTPEKHEGKNVCNEEKELSRKRKRGGHEDSFFPKKREEMTPEQLKQRIKRQVEYYLSDESLAYDAFFQSKMREAAQQGKGESLDLRFVLSSPRIKSLNLTKAEILAAIADSVAVKVKEEADGTTLLYRETPLPELQERPQRTACARREDGSGGASRLPQGVGRDPHAAGVFLKLCDIPESVQQWQQVKDAIKETLPGEVFVKFVSKIEEVSVSADKKTRRCWVYLGSFEDDRETLQKMQPIKIPLGDGEAEAYILTDQEVRLCVQDLPPRIRTAREKDLQTLRRQLAALPLSLGGIPFKSVEHLRMCMAEFLQKTPVDQALKPNSAAEKAVKGLLDYHPKAYIKKGGRDREVVGIKVGLHDKRDSQSGERSKCFFVVRKKKGAEQDEEDVEDFSVSKCISELAKDPPCEAEELNKLLRKRYESVAQQRAHAAEQAQKRRKIREEAARVTGAATAVAESSETSEKDEKQGADSNKNNDGPVAEPAATAPKEGQTAAEDSAQIAEAKVESQTA